MWARDSEPNNPFPGCALEHRIVENDPDIRSAQIFIRSCIIESGQLTFRVDPNTSDPNKHIKIWKRKSSIPPPPRGYFESFEEITDGAQMDVSLTPTQAFTLDVWIEAIRASDLDKIPFRIEYQRVDPIVIEVGGGSRWPVVDGGNFTILDFNLHADCQNKEGNAVPTPNVMDDFIAEVGRKYRYLDTPLPGKIIPFNQNDDNDDGVPDFFSPQRNEKSLVPMTLQLDGLSSINSGNSVRFRFRYDASDPTNDVQSPTVSRTDPRFSSMFIPQTDGATANSPLTLYSITKGLLRLWKSQGDATTSRSLSDYISDQSVHTVTEFGLSGANPTRTFYVEGVLPSWAPRAVPTELTCILEVYDGTQWVQLRQKKMPFEVVDLNVNVNTNNDPDFAMDDVDDAIEDQLNGFTFWPSRDAAGFLSDMGVVDLFPIVFKVPEAVRQNTNVFIQARAASTLSSTPRDF